MTSTIPAVSAAIWTSYPARLKAHGGTPLRGDEPVAKQIFEECVAEALEGWTCWRTDPITALEWAREAFVVLKNGRGTVVRWASAPDNGDMLLADDGTRIAVENVVKWMRVP